MDIAATVDPGMMPGRMKICGSNVESSGFRKQTPSIHLNPESNNLHKQTPSMDLNNNLDRQTPSMDFNAESNTLHKQTPSMDLNNNLHKQKPSMDLNAESNNLHKQTPSMDFNSEKKNLHRQTPSMDLNDVSNAQEEASHSNSTVVFTRNQDSSFSPYHLRRKENETSSRPMHNQSNTSTAPPPPPPPTTGYRRKYMNFVPPSTLPSTSTLPPSNNSKNSSNNKEGNYQRRYMQIPPKAPTPAIQQPHRFGLPPSGSRSRTNSNDNGYVGNRSRSNSNERQKGASSPVQTSIKQRPLNQLDMLGMPQPKLRPIDNRVRKGSFDANGPLLRRVRSSSIDSGAGSDGSFSCESTGGAATGLTAKLVDDVKQFLNGGESPNTSPSPPRGKYEDYGSINNEAASFHQQNQNFLKYVHLEQNRNGAFPGTIPKPAATWGDIQATEKKVEGRNQVRSRSPRPPNTRGQHRAGLRKFLDTFIIFHEYSPLTFCISFLASIENDNWDDVREEDINRGRTKKKNKALKSRKKKYYSSDESSSVASFTSSEESDFDDHNDDTVPFLPPDTKKVRKSKSKVASLFRDQSRDADPSNISPISSDEMEYSYSVSSKRSSMRTSRSSRHLYRGLSEKRLRKLHDAWEQERLEREEARRWYNRLRRWVEDQKFEEKISDFITNAQVLISNLPLTAAGLAVSYSSMANIWYKFMEVNVSNPCCILVLPFYNKIFVV